MGVPARETFDVAGATVHVTARGVRRTSIYRDEFDFVGWLRLLERTVRRYGWRCHAYCLMPNHFHLLIELAEPTLATGMQHLNGSYAQRFNLRYEHAGHVFEKRYDSKLVESEEHFLTVCRYIVLNPVRAQLCGDADSWPWSSFRATAGLVHCPPYLVADIVRSRFGKGAEALSQYRAFVADGAMSHGLAVGHDVRGQ